MTAAFSDMVSLTLRIRPKLKQLQSNASPGERLAAIAILNAFPDRTELGWLAERLDNPRTETPFIGYQAAPALGQAVRSLPDSDVDDLSDALDQALELAHRMPRDSDRIRLLEYAKRDLETRHRNR